MFTGPQVEVSIRVASDFFASLEEPIPIQITTTASKGEEKKEVFTAQSSPGKVLLVLVSLIREVFGDLSIMGDSLSPGLHRGYQGVPLRFWESL